MKASTKKIIDFLCARYSSLEGNLKDIEKCVSEIISCYKAGNKLLVCGNGGSASDALHITGELMKSFKLPRGLQPKEKDQIRFHGGEDTELLLNNIEGALPTISLVSEAALITAISNDKTGELIFAQQVFGLGHEGDILIAITTSGNSKNIIYASRIAKVRGMKVIALTGLNGGKIREIADVLIGVPEQATEKVQELHLPIYHAICAAVENEFYGGE